MGDWVGVIWLVEVVGLVRVVGLIRLVGLVRLVRPVGLVWVFWVPYNTSLFLGVLKPFNMY